MSSIELGNFFFLVNNQSRQLWVQSNDHIREDHTTRYVHQGTKASTDVQSKGETRAKGKQGSVPEWSSWVITGDLVGHLAGHRTGRNALGLDSVQDKVVSRP